MCSDQHVKYQMSRGFPLTSSLLLDYQVKQTYIYIHIAITVCMLDLRSSLFLVLLFWPVLLTVYYQVLTDDRLVQNIVKL